MHSLFDPLLGLHVVNVCIIIFITISIYFLVFAKEGALVESVFVWQVACFSYLILLSVEDVAALTWGAVFLASEDEDVTLRDWTSTKPILDICFEAAWPDFDEFPEGWLFQICGIKSFNVSDRWLISSEHINVPLLNGDSCGQISIPIEFWLFSPAVVLNAVHFTCLRRVVKSWTNCINEAVANCC